MGFEADPGYAAEASARAAGCAAVALAEALPLADESLQGVLCECALSVFANPHAALAEMARVLVRGGRLVVADLYRTDGEGGDAVADGSCAAGAAGREAVLARFARAGLTPRLFEDHSRLLAELAGRLVFAGFDMADAGAVLAGRSGGCACGPGGGRPRLGYYLCIAVKEGI
jgi:SAM-dependent methyltransferase